MSEEIRQDVHFSLDALMDVYYGTSDASEAVCSHIRLCASCAARWSELERRHAEAVRPVEVSAEFLAAQRRKIYERLEQPSRARWKLWAPAAAAAAVLAAAIFAYRPAPVQPRPEISDAQLFSDAYMLELSYEPAAAAPIQGLFEQQGFEETN